MIFDTTYKNKEDIELITDLVGKPFRLLQAVKMGGVGSQRMMIDTVSPNMQQYLNKVADINYANIELRSGGILVHLNKGLQNFSWAIPYYQLVLYKTDGSSIHAQGRYVKFTRNKLFEENKKFFSKLLDIKVQYDIDFKSPTMSL